MSLLFKIMMILSFWVLLSTQANIGRSWSDQQLSSVNHLDPRYGRGYEETFLQDSEDDNDDDGDTDGELIHPYGLNRQSIYPARFKSQASLNPWATHMNKLGEPDANKEGEYSSSLLDSDVEDDNGKGVDYLDHLLTNLIYYRNPLKKRNLYSSQSGGEFSDNGLIVKKMPETERWSTPIQPGDSNDLRKVRNLNQMGLYQFIPEVQKSEIFNDQHSFRGRKQQQHQKEEVESANSFSDHSSMKSSTKRSSESESVSSQ
ncbi:unnamed protein product [Heterobilharzia americana]|nr:unnamed protein product [Heterobilharzia americana]